MTFRLVLAVLLLIAGIIALIWGRRIQRAVEAGTEMEPHRNIGRSIGIGLLIASAIFGIWSCVRVVDPGQVGIPVALGKTGAPLGPGIHFTNPLSNVESMSIRTENYTMSVANAEGNKQGDDSVSVLGSDGGGAGVDSTALYHLTEGDASSVYGTYGTGYAEKIVRPAIRTCIRNEFARVAMVDAATTKRDQVATAIKACVEGQLKNTGLVLEDLLVRDIHLSPELQNSINLKVSAQQASEQQAFELTKTIQQAEIARTDAQGRSDSQQIIACGGTTVPNEGGGTKVIPKQGSDCQNTLTPEYLQYLYIQSLKDVAASPNHSTIIVPFDQNLTPLINIPNG